MSFSNNKKKKIDIVNRINKVAKQYKNNLVGKTFLILYEGQAIEVIFKTENFLHLCGVDTNLYAKDFYKKALKGILQPYEIGFSEDIHPYKFADIKTKNLEEALSILKRDSLIITNLYTPTKTYKLGATDLELVFCFDEQYDEFSSSSKKLYIPYSLRVEEIANSRFNEIYEVDFVLSKETGTTEYQTVEFGDISILNQYLLKYNIKQYPISIKQQSTKNEIESPIFNKESNQSISPIIQEDEIDDYDIDY